MRRRSPKRPWIENLWRTPLASDYLPLWAGAAPASFAYGAVLALRERWWHAMSRHAGVPTISVGNLTVGGNGKTPFSLFLARLLRANGLSVGLISRGWRRRGHLSGAIVSDGTRILLSNVREAGDEPLMMAKSFAGPIAIGRRRINAITLLEDYLQRRSQLLDAVILDDGFQHLRLKRDLNLLLINTMRGFGNGWLLPAGPMRDRPAAIGRAHAIVFLHNGDAKSEAPPGCDPRYLEGKTLLHARLEPQSLVSAESRADDLSLAPRWREHKLELSGKRVIAVSGLADPEGFHAMLGRLGADVVATLAFADHHDYGPYDIEKILALAGKSEWVITTEKDLVKLEYFPLTGLPLYALRVAVTMPPADEQHLLRLAIGAIDSRRDRQARL
jgi:tetraacyldisaccharide 4'-kinase